MARQESVYMDYNAGAPLHGIALKRLQEFQAQRQPLNPSSLHNFGRNARGLLENARKSVLRSVEAPPSARLVFTSGGTEANNMALKSFAFDNVIVGATEHPSVRNVRPDAVICPVDENGRVLRENLGDILRSLSGRTLVSIMAANNETGVIQDLPPLISVAREYGAVFHTDASQAYGKIPFSLAETDADMVTLSAHKIGALPGVGALIYPKKMTPVPLIDGGGQEFRARSGTENVMAASVFGNLAEALGDVRSEFTACQKLRDKLENNLPDCYIYGGEAPRLPNTSCFAIPGIPSETQLVHFDLEGFAVSNGAACSSGTVTTSPVLQAMHPNAAAFAIRASLGADVAASHIDAFIESVQKLLNRR